MDTQSIDDLSPDWTDRIKGCSRILEYDGQTMTITRASPAIKGNVVPGEANAAVADPGLDWQNAHDRKSGD